MSERLDLLMRLHEAEPDDPFCTYGIALEHAKAGKRDEAIQWLDKTLELDDGYCYAYYQKARVLSEMNRLDSARAVLRVGMEAATQANDEHAHREMTELLESFE